MSQVEFHGVLEQVRELSPADQWRLREFLEALLAVPPGLPTGADLSEDEFEQQLVREGVISVPPPNADLTSFQRYTPIEVEGKPVSETIIEERR